MRYSFQHARAAWHSLKQCDAHVFTRARWRQRQREIEADRERGFEVDGELSFYKLPARRECPPTWQPTPRRAEPNPKYSDFQLIDWRDQDTFAGHEFRTRFLLPVR